MNYTEMIELFDSTMSANKELLLKKMQDYADEDVLTVFKDVAAIAALNPEDVALVMIGVKVSRIGNLLGKTEVNFESLDDSINDLINYAFLLKCIRNESR